MTGSDSPLTAGHSIEYAHGDRQILLRGLLQDGIMCGLKDAVGRVR